MPEFLYRARGPSGELIADRVAAATLEQARQVLEARGCRDLEFHSHDNAAEIARMLAAETGIPPADPAEWSAADEIESRRRRGTGRKLWWAFTKHLAIFSLLVKWGLGAWLAGPPYGGLDWLGFVAAPLYLIFFIFQVLPMLVFNQLLEASVWQEWKRLARWTALARALRWVRRTGIPESELVYREAYALAAQGNLSAALQHAEQLRALPARAEYLHLARVSSIHEYAGDYAGQLRCVERAAALRPDTTDVWIDLASVRLRRFANVAGAREALTRVEGKELAEVPKAVLLLIQGMLACMERDFVAADGCLQGAAQRLAKIGNPLIQTPQAELNAWWAIALAGLGRTDEARQAFAAARPLLVVQKSHPLLNRVQSALAGAGAR